MIIISFAMTTAALRAERKTVTRQDWSDAYAERVRRSLEKSGGLAQAWSASPHRKGEKVGVVRVLSIQKEKTSDIPDSDWEAEGFAYMAEQGLSLGKDLTCEQHWRKWRQDTSKEAYTVRFMVAELLCQVCGEAIPIPDDGRFEAGEYEVLCGDCYIDDFTFECVRCHESKPIEEQGQIGAHIVIVDEDEADKPVGLYRILNHPYYVSAVVGAGWIIGSAVDRVGDVPQGIDTDGYPVGHLCRECSAKSLAEIAERLASEVAA